MGHPRPHKDLPVGDPPPPELCPHTPWDTPRLTPASPGAARCPHAGGWGDSPAWGPAGSAAAAGTGRESARGSQTALRGQRDCPHPAHPAPPRGSTQGMSQRWLCPAEVSHCWARSALGWSPWGSQGVGVPGVTAMGTGGHGTWGGPQGAGGGRVGGPWDGPYRGHRVLGSQG